MNKHKVFCKNAEGKTLLIVLVSALVEKDPEIFARDIVKRHILKNSIVDYEVAHPRAWPKE